MERGLREVLFGDPTQPKEWGKFWLIYSVGMIAGLTLLLLLTALPEILVGLLKLLNLW